jgi:hypothetical protein
MVGVIVGLDDDVGLSDSEGSLLGDDEAVVLLSLMVHAELKRTTVMAGL